MKPFITISICGLLALAVLLLAFPKTEIAHFVSSYLARPFDPQPAVRFDWQRRAGLVAAAAACLWLLHLWGEREPS